MQLTHLDGDVRLDSDHATESSLTRRRLWTSTKLCLLKTKLRSQTLATVMSNTDIRDLMNADERSRKNEEVGMYTLGLDASHWIIMTNGDGTQMLGCCSVATVGLVVQ